MRKVKIGIVGLGRLGSKHAFNLAYKVPNAELIAACSIIKEEREEAQKKFGVQYVYSDFNEMIQNKELEAVAIVSSSKEHCSHITAALEAGLHVFSEKPLGITIEECKKIEKIVEKRKNKVFLLGFQRRFDPSYAYAQELIRSGKYGKPIIVRATSIDPETTIEGAIRYAPSGGGIFIDMTVHDIDLARWFLGAEPVKVFATGGSYFHKEFAENNDADNACAVMNFDNGGMALFFQSRDGFHGYHVETEVVCTNGTLRIGNVPQKNNVEILASDGIVRKCTESFQERFDSAYYLEMQEFIDCIVEGRKPDINVYDGTLNSIAAIAMTKAFRTGEIVDIKE